MTVSRLAPCTGAPEGPIILLDPVGFAGLPLDREIALHHAETYKAGGRRVVRLRGDRERTRHGRQGQ